MAGRSPPWMLMLPVLAVMLVLALVPTAQLLLESLRIADGAADLGLGNFEDFFASSIGRQAALRSIRVSIAVTLVCALAGYPIALSLSRARGALRGIMLAIVIFPLLISVVVRAYGWTVVLGRNGLVNRVLETMGLIGEPLALVHNELGIVIGEIHLLLPYMVLSLLAVIQTIDPRLIEAAQSLGARPWVVTLRVVLPMTLPGLLTGTLLVFSLAMTAFATPFLLGGGRAPMLTVLIYDYAFTLFDWTKAATVSVVLVALGFLFVAMHRLVAERGLRAMD